MTRLISINDPLVLPCGAVIPNRLCKAAMTEGLADSLNRSTPELDRLYETWSRGGAGLLISGNVQIDRSHLERPGNIVIDANGGIDALKRLARAGTVAGNQFWMQINHPGRQTDQRINPAPGAPSAVALEAVGHYGMPRPLTESEILDIIRRFAHVAMVARDTGFTGIQIHAAHGYLLSQFLSPRANRREDDWGGSLANRARILLEIVRATRKAVGDDFPVAVKLNSSDFQTGGFEMSEAVQVAGWLSDEKIDLLELSGGNYERQSMGGLDTPADSTLRREAHFLDFAHEIRPAVSVPLMVTGGFRTRRAMNASLESGDTDMVGIASPFCIEPDFAAKLLVASTERSAYDEDYIKSMVRTAAKPDDSLITIAGSPIFLQIISLGRTGAVRTGLIYHEACDEFLAHENACFENLVDFHTR